MKLQKLHYHPKAFDGVQSINLRASLSHQYKADVNSRYKKLKKPITKA